MGFQPSPLAASARQAGWLAALALLIVVAIGASIRIAIAAPDEGAAPLSGLSLDFGSRKLSLSLESGAPAPLLARGIPFQPGRSDIAGEGARAVTALRNAIRAAKASEPALAIVVSGSDAYLSHRRARAIRAWLVDRHRLDPERIVAVAMAGPDAGESLARVSVFAIDPRCQACDGLSLRTVALDSGAAKLVQADPAGLPPGPMLAEAPVEKPAVRTIPLPASDAPPPPRPRPIVAERRPPPPAPLLPSEDCPRPRIVIDDYYPGGPMRNCDGSRRGLR